VGTVRPGEACLARTHAQIEDEARLAYSRPASTTRCRNCCVRGSQGAPKISAGVPCSRMTHTLVEEAHAMGDVSRKAHLVRGNEHRHPVIRELADDLEHLRDELRVDDRERAHPEEDGAGEAAEDRATERGHEDDVDGGPDGK